METATNNKLGQQKIFTLRKFNPTVKEAAARLGRRGQE